MICYKHIIVFALLMAFVESASRIGRTCRYDSDCSSQNFGGDNTQMCVKKICQCQPGIEVEYDSSLRPSCEEFMHSLKVLGGECRDESDPEETSSFRKPKLCGENEECRVSQGNGTRNIWSNLGKKLCYCKQGYIRVGDDCLQASHQDVLQPCRKNGNEVLSCNLEEYSICSNRKCICFDTYFANTTSGKCEPFTQYMKAFNLTEYRVKPNEYCTEDRHCISGLECKSNKCSCPRPCTYNSTAEICDCGKVVKTAPSSPIALGVVLGLIIVIFWAAMIKRTVAKYTKKANARFTNLENDARPSPSHNSYVLNPVSPNRTPSGVSAPPAGLSVPFTNGSGRHSPSPLLSETDPLNTKTSSDLPPPYSSVFPPSPGNVGTSASNPTDSRSALPYPTNPTDSTSALPYPTNPTDSTSALPYPTNPTDSISAPPYPSNPTDSTSALPYSTTPSALPYSVSPSTTPYPTSPYSHNPSDVTPFGASYSTPKQESDNSVAPPAYNPSFP